MERQKQIKDIGQLSGPVLAFGGVYSNLQALERLQTIANALGIPPERIICTGDVVGYCAYPEESVQAVQEWGIHVIAGNVELQLREGQDDCGCDFRSGGRCDTFSRQWYPFAKAQLSAASIAWMDTLPDFIRFEMAGQRGLVLHGSWHEVAEYIFNSTDWAIKARNFEDSDSDIILAGHCGLPFQEVKDQKYWLNPGVIGMPANDGSTHIWYMLLDQNAEGKLIFSHHSYEYDFEKAASAMEAQKLPLAYAKTLRTGIWDNCEILPEVETSLQGVAIELA